MPAFVARYAQAFADVVKDLKLDPAALDRQFADFLATWEGSAELRTFFENPAIPAAQKVGILDKLNAKLGHAEGVAQPARRAHRQRSHRARGGSGRGVAQNSAGATGHSSRGDCDRARIDEG